MGRSTFAETSPPSLAMRSFFLCGSARIAFFVVAVVVAVRRDVARRLFWQTLPRGALPAMMGAYSHSV